MRSKVVFALLLLLAGAAAVLAADEKKAPWKFSGQLEEACSCDASCPCWFESKPTKMTCSGGQVIFIEKGKYGDVPLDGLAIAFVGQSPKGKSMVESGGKWNFGYYYIDEKANPAQRKALEEIARATVPPPAPQSMTRVRYTPITRQVSGSEHVVTLGKYGSFSGHLVAGGMGIGAPKIVLPPGADPIHKEYSQGRTTKQTYNDAGQKWNWANSNYMFATFEVSSDDYDKFNSFMVQETKKAKTEKKPEKKAEKTEPKKS